MILIVKYLRLIRFLKDFKGDTAGKILIGILPYFLKATFNSIHFVLKFLGSQMEAVQTGS
ncbi:hypothetical protein Gferi_27020 [Geosporobacter ferrireducens]|uniref:Uncharacterized protein n=1 Tax=Geosporobacter ferrireducens TaxID=1424294 RepID=A0A1D8GPP8_9FIRM|nr:hypothetical protein Gferi_27020 [Geosporobacter ferrireducens]